jgi:acyl-coenzyme A thioesterase PaaI-like protein
VPVVARPSDPDWADRLTEAREGELPPRRAELVRLADATRAIIDRLVATGASEEALTRATAHVERAVAELAGERQGRSYEGFAESALAGGIGSGDAKPYFDHSPIIGGANPLAPPVEVEVVDGMVRASARFGAAYEGPPGSVHGGWIAAAFDEVLGMVQSLSGAPGMTGTLEVRYRRPTPLHADLRFEATLDRRDGRKLFTSARLYLEDQLTAEAKGLFISVDFEKIAAMMASRGDAGAGAPPA